MPMFPDSGVPAGDAKNTIDVNTNNCGELWYSTSRCQPRFDPAAANAMLAEDMNLIMKGELIYDCTRLDHIERAVRYINQRGLPRAALLTGGPQAYTAILDPAVTRHNDFMTLTIIPAVTNIANVTLNIGIGVVPLLRNDNQNLKAGDLLVGKPYIIAYYAGVWYMCGLASSQVPIVVTGGLDFWIRPDGNDVTGDGTANTPDKAFKTIAGAWYAVGARYAATPSFSINMKLGVPATYDGAYIGPFGGRVSLTGDPGNPAAYRLRSIDVSGIGREYAAFVSAGVADMFISGVTFQLDHPPPGNNFALRVGAGVVAAHNCIWDVMVDNANGLLIHMNGGWFGAADTVLTFNGNGHTISGAISANEGSNFFVRQTYFPTPFNFSNFACLGPFIQIGMLTTFSWGAGIVSAPAVTGMQHIVTQNSVLDYNGQPRVGAIPGVIASGGQVIG